MKKVLVCMTAAYFLFGLGNVTQYSDPGEPIGAIVGEDSVVKIEKKPKKEKINFTDDARKLDPGEPIGT